MANDIEEELVMLNSSAVNVFRSVASVTGSPTVAIANLASKPQNVSLSCLQQGRRPVFGRLLVPASHTVLVRSCKESALPENAIDLAFSQPDLGDSPQTFGVSVESDGAAGTLAVFGVAPRAPMVYESVPFVQTGTLRSSGSTYPGIPVGVTQTLGFKQFVPELGVANFGFKPANVKVLYTSTALSNDAPQEVANIPFRPSRQRPLPSRICQGDPNIQNSFSIETDAEKGQVISSLHARSTDGEQIVDLPNQDQKKPANGGQHPWVLDKNTASYLLLYNADTLSTRNIGVTLYTEIGGRFSKTVQIKPGHTVALSVGELVKEMKGVKAFDTDSPGAAHPLTPQHGIITWLSLEAATVFGRMLQVNDTQMWSRNFSCQVEYIACAATVSPDAITLSPGGSNTLNGYANVCPSIGQCTCDGSGSCTYQTEPASSYYWWSDNPSIASTSGSVYGSSVTVSGNAFGQTNVELSVTDGSDYQCSGSTSYAYGQPGQIKVTCPTPNGETTSFSQWADNDPNFNDSPSIAEWIQTLQPNANYSNGTISESDFSPAADGCWFDGSPYPPTNGVAGSSWQVGADARWGPDGVGYPNYAEFGYYQVQRVQRGLSMPCNVRLFQQLTYKCSDGTNTPYDQDILQVTISGTGLTVSREGQTQARTLEAY